MSPKKKQLPPNVMRCRFSVCQLRTKTKVTDHWIGNREERYQFVDPETFDTPEAAVAYIEKQGSYSGPYTILQIYDIIYQETE